MKKQLSYILLVIQLFIGLPLHAMKGGKPEVARTVETSQPARTGQTGEPEGYKETEPREVQTGKSPTQPVTGAETATEPTYMSYSEVAQSIQKGNVDIAIKNVNSIKNSFKDTIGPKTSISELSAKLGDVVSAYGELISSYDPTLASSNPQRTPFTILTGRAWDNLDPRIQDAINDLESFFKNQSQALGRDLRQTNGTMNGVIAYLKSQDPSDMNLHSQSTYYLILVTDAKMDFSYFLGDASKNTQLTFKVRQLESKLLDVQKEMQASVDKSMNNNSKLSWDNFKKVLDTWFSSLKIQMNVLKDQIKDLTGKVRNDAILTYEACACETAYTSALFKSVNDASNLMATADIVALLDSAKNDPKATDADRKFIDDIMTVMLQVKDIDQKSVTSFRDEMNKITGRNVAQETYQPIPDAQLANFNRQLGIAFQNKCESLIQEYNEAGPAGLTPKQMSTYYVDIGKWADQAVTALQDAQAYYDSVGDTKKSQDVTGRINALLSPRKDVQRLVIEARKDFQNSPKPAFAQARQSLADIGDSKQITNAFQTLYGGTDINNQLTKAVDVAKRSKQIDSALVTSVAVLVVINIVAASYLLSLILTKNKK